MKYDVFISYSFKDADSAHSLCALCEKSGLKCFLAERDIPKGQRWAPYIVDAINNSSVMVALFSANYNLSTEVDREITLASNKHIPILVYRIDMSDFEGTKAYYFSNVNWFSPTSSNSGQDFVKCVISLINREDIAIELKPIDEGVEAQLMSSSIEAANSGDIESQFYLGCYYEERNEFEKAIFWYREAAKGGLVEACFNVANMIIQNKASALFPHEAFDNAQKAYMKEVPYAALLLAWCFTYGNGVQQDYMLGWQYLEEFMVSGVNETKSLGTAYYIAGNYHRFGWGPIQQDISKAISYWEKAAELNNRDAIFNLGASYLNGDGVQRDGQLAFSYFEKGVRLDDPQCYKGIAMCYRSGVYVKQNIESAIAWYKKAATAGDADAFACIGSIYSFGEGVPRDYTEAARWFYEAATRGHVTAQRNLAILYYNGWGVPCNDAEAIKWFKAAASQGDMDSIVFLKKIGEI